MLHGHHQFAALVYRFMPEPDHAEAGPGFERARLKHGDRAPQRITGEHGLAPFDEIDAGRAFAGSELQDRVEELAHGKRTGVPAGGGQPTENAGLAGLFGEVKGLRIEVLGETDDFIRRYCPGRVVERAAGREIFEPVLDFGHFRLQLQFRNDLAEKRCFGEFAQVKFDLSDWESRKRLLLPVLDDAAREGLVQRDATARLGEFLLGRGVNVGAPVSTLVTEDSGLDTPRASEPASTVEESEAPRFIRGFHDILITIGIIVGLLGLGGLATVYAVIPAAIILGEVLVRRQRLALPAVVLTIAIGIAATIGIHPIWDGISPDRQLWMSVGNTVALSAIMFLTYWRYRIPLALAGGLVTLFGAITVCAAIAVRYLSNEPAFFDDHPLALACLLGVFALAVFGTALKFDFADRNRVTRRSDVAFWMHLAAAPAILFAIMTLIYLGKAMVWFSAGTSVWQAAAVVGAVLLLMLIGIVLDRRAFVTSGLLSFGYAFRVLLTEGGFTEVFAAGETLVFVTLLTIGVVVLSLGIGWQPLRRVIVGNLPNGLQSLLPAVR